MNKIHFHSCKWKHEICSGKSALVFRSLARFLSFCRLHDFNNVQRPGLASQDRFWGRAAGVLQAQALSDDTAGAGVALLTRAPRLGTSSLVPGPTFINAFPTQLTYLPLYCYTAITNPMPLYSLLWRIMNLWHSSHLLLIPLIDLKFW